MGKSLRRWVALFIIPFFVFSLYPQKRSQAILPLAIPLTVMLIDAAGAVISADALAAVGTALLGGLAMAAIFLTPGDTTNTNGQVRVPTTTAAGSSTAIPAPTGAPGTASPVVMWQPYCNGCGWSEGYTFASALDAANSFCVHQGYGATGSVRSGNHPACGAGGTYYNDTIFWLLSQSICPNGYTGSPCTLSDSRQVVQDGKQDVTRSGTTLGVGANDLHGTAAATVKTTTVANDTVQASAQDASGNRRVVQVVATADGGSKVISNTEVKDGAGNTYVQGQTITISPAGVVTNVASTPLAQTLVLDPATGQLTPTAAATGATYTPVAASSGSTTITFPTDYARDATVAAQNAKLDTLHTDSQQIHTDLTTTTGTAPADPAVKADSDITGQLLDSNFSGLKAWAMPSRSVSCPTASFVLWSSTYTINGHCTLWASIGSTIHAVALLSWGMLALFIVLGA